MSEDESRLADRMGADADRIYNLLMQAHDGLDEPTSHALNARLVLLMVNEIGNADRVEALIAAGLQDLP